MAVCAAGGDSSDPNRTLQMDEADEIMDFDQRSHDTMTSEWHDHVQCLKGTPPHGESYFKNVS